MFHRIYKKFIKKVDNDTKELYNSPKKNHLNLDFSDKKIKDFDYKIKYLDELSNRQNKSIFIDNKIK